MPTNILRECGYAAISIGTFVEGEAVLLSAGALAHAGFLSLPLVVLAAALGSFACGQSWFRFGSVSGRALIARRPAWQARVAVVERWLARHERWLLLFGRFIFGMGTLLPAVVGASGYAWRRFVVLDSIGALIWATTFACAGFAGAVGVRHWLGHPVAWSSFGVAAGVLAVAFWLLAHAFTASCVRGSAPPDNTPQG
jgi:membrane protein DedA with SNARE-associated domain